MVKIERDGETFDIKERIPLLPLRDVVVFPYMIIPLLVGRPGSVKALERAMAEDRQILAVAQKQSETAEPQPRDLFRMGTICRVLQLLRLPDGTMRVLVEGLCRVRVTRFLPQDELMAARTKAVEETYAEDTETEALVRSARTQFEEYVRLHRRIPDEVLLALANIHEPRRLVYVIGAHLVAELQVKQELLGTESLRDQLLLLSRHLSRELEILGIEHKIDGEVRSQVQRNQREFYLTEQLKAIRKELGEQGDPSGDADELEEQVRRAEMPAEVEAKALKEVDRLRKMTPLSPEAAVVRNYVDWLVGLPWNKTTTDNLDLTKAERILEEDHYGLKKAKERVLEFLAVLRLVGEMKGPILCFVGPPGVGKSSLGRSIARALGREFVRASLGGVRDEAEIRGHRRTYIGALPGRIIQRMRKAGTKNPVFLLDEVDKLASDYRGDPAAALLEVLDPEQNHAFNDHFLEVDYDLSQVLFVATANVLDTIPPALRDRMEILRLPGYLEYEKVKIAQGFLVPRNLESHGLKDSGIRFTDEALSTIIRNYTRESGVRNLEREITSVCRKLARRVAGDLAVSSAKQTRTKKKPNYLRVGAKQARKILGVPRFSGRELRSSDQVGVAAGLAWTEVGGEVLFVEAVALPGKGKLTLTGKLGEVMRESGRAALSYARQRATTLGLASDFYESTDIHVHIPEGAIPKDGPSAGITMAVAMLSALSRIPVRKDVALTGEITLNGEVLQVGGLNEKVVAARRAGFKTVIIPRENEKDLPDLPRELTSGLELALAENMDDALRVALATEESVHPASAGRRPRSTRKTVDRTTPDLPH